MSDNDLKKLTMVSQSLFYGEQLQLLQLLVILAITLL